MPDNSLNHLLLTFSAALNGLALYPHKHPANVALHTSLWESLQSVWQKEQDINIGIIEQALFINKHLCQEDNPAATAIAKLLIRHKIRGFIISCKLQLEELQRFTALLSQGNLNGDNFNQTLEHHNINNIHYMSRKEDSDKGRTGARATYDEAIHAIEKVGHFINTGLVPPSNEIFPAIAKMVRQTIKNPYALLALSRIKDYDDYTFTHSVNVSVIALAIGRACQLSDDDLHILGVGSLLHDLGKLKINPAIIKKPGRLSPQEYQKIKQHPEFGAQIAQEMDNIHPKMISIILGHHHHYDRCGYPAPKQDFIDSELVDIATVADTYDAITTTRPYRHPNTPRDAITIMSNLSGTQLHPRYFHALQQTLGTFPVGSVVRLFNNEIGLVVNMDNLNIENSTVRIIKDGYGNQVDNQYEIELDNSSKNIVGEVDPLIHNIDIRKTLTSSTEQKLLQ